MPCAVGAAGAEKGSNEEVDFKDISIEEAMKLLEVSPNFRHYLHYSSLLFSFNTNLIGNNLLFPSILSAMGLLGWEHAPWAVQPSIPILCDFQTTNRICSQSQFCKI